MDRRKRLDAGAFARYVQEQIEPVEWVMEACGTAHHWGRLMQEKGHRVVLLHPRYVRPYRRRNKTDRNDCDAILEAARCQDIRPVPVKTAQQQQADPWRKAALLAAKRCTARTPERLTQLQSWALQNAERIGHNKAAVALANKLVRICWAVWCHERRFSGNWRTTKPA